MSQLNHTSLSLKNAHHNQEEQSFHDQHLKYDAQVGHIMRPTHFPWVTTLKRQIQRWARPPVQEDVRRFEWNCVCTTTDFYRLVILTLWRHAGKNYTAISIKTSTPKVFVISTMTLSNRNSSQKKIPQESKSLQRNYAILSMIVELEIPSHATYRQYLIDQPKYLELCINTGQYSTSLGEIDLSHVKSDGELFLKIWERYREMRPFRLRRIFSQPVDVHFVRVGFSHYFKASAANNLNLSCVSFAYSGRTKSVSTANPWKCHRRKRWGRITMSSAAPSLLLWGGESFYITFTSVRWVRIHTRLIWNDFPRSWKRACISFSQKG